MKKIKLGNYFTKGVKVGALATAVLMNAGCDELSQLCDDQVEVQQQEEVWNGEDLPSYIFARHRFAAENAKITRDDSQETRIKWANKHYQHAVDYMRAKVADFRDKVYNQEPDGNFLQAVCDEEFERFADPIKQLNKVPTDGYDFSNNLDQMIGATALRYGHLSSAISAKAAIARNDAGMWNKTGDVFSNCLAMLAVRSYNDSLGYLSNSHTMPINQNNTQFAKRLAELEIIPEYYGYFDSINNYPKIENALNDILVDAAAETGVSLATLQDAVNLYLLNAGMWGTRDLGAQAYVQLSSSKTFQIPVLTPFSCDDIIGTSTSQAKYIYKFHQEAQNNQGKGL